MSARRPREQEQEPNTTTVVDWYQDQSAEADNKLSFKLYLNLTYVLGFARCT